MNLQDMVDGMNARMQRDRAQGQVTLGALIEQLAALPGDAIVRGLGELMSYRGYYCDLAFEPSDRDEPIAVLLERCRAAMGRVFQGYKGGDFLMGETTPLWIAPYGSSGERLMGLNLGARPMVPMTAAEES